MDDPNPQKARSRFSGTLIPTILVVVLAACASGRTDYSGGHLPPAAAEQPEKTKSPVQQREDATLACPDVQLGPDGKIVHHFAQHVLRLGRAYARGSLEQALIERIIGCHLKEVQVCYERQLARERPFRGSMTVSYQISPMGLVSETLLQASTTSLATDLEQCILDFVRGLKFPKSQGETGSSYSFELMPEQAGAQ